VKASPFLFANDFRAPKPDPEPDRTAEIEREAAVAAAFERGLAEGRAAANAAIAARLADAMERLAGEAGRAIAGQDRVVEDLEQQALRFFSALARKLAGEAIEARPLAPVAELAAEAFQHLRGVPHLAVRVHPALVEDADREIRAMARERGFEGRTVVLGDEQLSPGDARLEWADGGLARETDVLHAAVERILFDAAAHSTDRG
jgi:flagellar assembly protein FliH